jgi:hypothetical protein
MYGISYMFRHYIAILRERSYIINKLNEQLLHLLVFHAHINEMHGSRRKIPSKKSRQAVLRGGI